MNVIVDTDVWSEAFRKIEGTKSKHYDELLLLIKEGRVELPGFVKMEVLCGIKHKGLFDKIQKRLSAFKERPLEPDVFVMAAQFLNLCRSKGIQGPNNDFIICAASVYWQLPILSRDKGFEHFRRFLPIELHKPR